jgi:membrane-associated HD superfamily phosphohydrolase
MERMKKEWLKEQARDLIAFGSIPFLVLTIARVSEVATYYVMQFIISSILFFILKMIFKAELRAGIGLILLTFTSIFYNNALFTAFALIIYVGIIVSLFYLKRDKAQILKGILLGLISTGIGYFIVRLIFF